MCGRFTQIYDWETVRDFYDLMNDLALNIPLAYNLAPTQMIYAFAKKRILTPVRWGLIPTWWTKPLKELPSTFNARAESIASKPMFRAAFKTQRCLIPASGFFEWTGPKGQRQPWYIKSRSDEILTFAGVYETWTDSQTGQHILSTTIITCEANAIMSPIHSRMPVILGREQWNQWLEHADQALLQPCPEDWLEAFQVSSKISNSRYQMADSIDPIPPQAD